MTTKSISIKGAERKFGGAVRKAVILTSGGLCLVSHSGLGEPGGDLITAQESAEGIVDAESIEGPNGLER
jgi:hypothetical protein